MSGSHSGDARYASIGVEGTHGDIGVQYFFTRSQALFIGPIEKHLAIVFSPAPGQFLPTVRR